MDSHSKERGAVHGSTVTTPAARIKPNKLIPAEMYFSEQKLEQVVHLTLTLALENKYNFLQIKPQTSTLCTSSSQDSPLQIHLTEDRLQLKTNNHFSSALLIPKRRTTLAIFHLISKNLLTVSETAFASIRFLVCI